LNGNDEDQADGLSAGCQKFNLCFCRWSNGPFTLWTWYIAAFDNLTSEGTKVRNIGIEISVLAC